MPKAKKVVAVVVQDKNGGLHIQNAQAGGFGIKDVLRVGKKVASGVKKAYDVGKKVYDKAKETKAVSKILKTGGDVIGAVNPALGKTVSNLGQEAEQAGFGSRPPPFINRNMRGGAMVSSGTYHGVFQPHVQGGMLRQ